MTGTSIEDMEKVGDDLLVSSFITNSLGMDPSVVRVAAGRVKVITSSQHVYTGYQSMPRPLIVAQ
jgi:hypothetical protein